MIIIDDGKVKIVQQVVEREISTDEFIREVANQAPVQFPIMPENTKGFIASSGATGLIIEQAPRLQTVKYRGTVGSSRVVADFNVYLPWTYYVLLLRNTPLAIEHTQMFFAKNRVMSEKDATGWMCLPNFRPHNEFGTAEMCAGEIQVSDNQTIPNFCNDLIVQIWSSLFNRDLVNIGQDGSLFIHKAMEEYSIDHVRTKHDAETNAKRKKELALIMNNDEPAARYLYAWEQLSNSMELPEFIEKLTFPFNWTYDKTLNGIKQFCHRGTR